MIWPVVRWVIYATITGVSVAADGYDAGARLWRRLRPKRSRRDR